MKFLEGKLPAEKIEINTNRCNKRDSFSMISTFEVSKHANKVNGCFDFELAHQSASE